MIHVLMVGSGEYTVGIIPSENSKQSSSDKNFGVVALTFLHLRSKGLIDWLGLVATSNQKARKAQQWIQDGLGNSYSNIDTSLDAIYPSSDSPSSTVPPYMEAINLMKPGGIVTIFTPDDTHFDIASYAISRKQHVIIAKPVVLSIHQHYSLISLSKKHNVLVCGEFHKRFDPIYADAKNIISSFQKISYFYSYMSQPKYQLETFKHWILKGASDISFYLNSHHIDYLCWCLNGLAVPVSVYASSANGIANNILDTQSCIEDSITLVVGFRYLSNGSSFTAVFTSSWVAPNISEVHSQQRFHCLGDKEVLIDQAHRGYSVTDDTTGYKSKNPLFMNYTPSNGKFVGDKSYGYQSFKVFTEACNLLNQNKVFIDHQNGTLSSDDFENNDIFSLALIHKSIFVTAILEAGRKSLDLGRIIYIVVKGDNGSVELSPSS